MILFSYRWTTHSWAWWDQKVLVGVEVLNHRHPIFPIGTNPDLLFLPLVLHLLVHHLLVLLLPHITKEEADKWKRVAAFQALLRFLNVAESSLNPADGKVQICGGENMQIMQINNQTTNISKDSKIRKHLFVHLHQKINCQWLMGVAIIFCHHYQGVYWEIWGLMMIKMAGATKTRGILGNPPLEIFMYLPLSGGAWMQSVDTHSKMNNSDHLLQFCMGCV